MMKALAGAWVAFFAVELMLRSFLPGPLRIGNVGVAVALSLCYAVIVLLVTQVNRVVLSVFYLVLPLVLFAVGWLHWYLALPVVFLVLGCLIRTLREEKALEPQGMTWSEIAAFSILIIWVHLSGACGLGHQSIDYVMHNGRLHDLISYSWPVRYAEVAHDWPMEYGGERNLVFYLSYYLPAAAIGKLLGFSTALKAQFLWLLLGVTIAFQWFRHFTRATHLPALALVLVVFGGWDIIGLWIAKGVDPDVALFALGNPPFIHNVDTWSYPIFASEVLRAYPANTFQLFFAPHQIVAGWIIVSLQAHLFFSERLGALGLVTALYALWSPLMLLAMLPFVIFLCIGLGHRKFVGLLTVENLLGAPIIVALFGCYYLAGGAGVVPGGLLWEEIDLAGMWPRLLVLYACGWGVYFALVLPYAQTAPRPRRIWVASMGLTLLVLPAYYYGECNDLMLRGSAPFTFMLMVLLLIAARAYFQEGRRILAWLALVALLPGAGSAAFQAGTAVAHYGVRQPVVSVSHYAEWNYEQLGSEDSFFFRYLARE